MRTEFMAISAAAALVAGASVYAERRRMHRSDLDRVGFVPWQSVLMFAMLVAIVSAVLAIKT